MSTSYRRLFAFVGMISMCIASGRDAGAQQKPAIETADFGRWETPARGAVMSPDGGWLAYPINRSNRENELRVASTTSDAATTAAFGERAAFSTDSGWLAYAITLSEEETARRRDSREPIERRMGLLDLESMTTEEIDAVEEFAFSGTGAYLALHRYPARDGDRDRDDDSPGDDDPVGGDLVVRALGAGTQVSFANVAEFAWQDEGTLLAMTIAARGRAGNGVQLYDAATGAVRALESDTAVYRGLSWREDDDDLALLVSRTAAGFEEDTHVVLAWRDLGSPDPKPLRYDQTDDAAFPPRTRIVSERRLIWSDAGDSIFLGVKDWSVRAEPDAEEDDASAGKDGEVKADVESAEVDVWHARDLRIIPMQKVQQGRDENRSLLAVWHLDESRFVQLGSDLMEVIDVLEGQAYAVARHTDRYAFDTMFGRPWMDLHLIDAESGKRRSVVEKIRHFHLGSATGRFLLYFKDGHFWTHDISTGTQTNITKSLLASFGNAQFDRPTEQRPAYGVAGWSATDDWVLLYDRYDIWRVAPDGSSGMNLTNGAADAIRHRYVDLDTDGPGGGPGRQGSRPTTIIDLDEPLYVSLYGQWSKQHGYGRLADGGRPVTHLLWLDKNVGRLMKATAANRFGYLTQGFDDSPDYFVGGPDLANARQISNTNPFQPEFAWGRSELVDYSSVDGQRLQGALFYPANYEPGRQYPMIVYVYELRSQFVHTYAAPSERSPYNTSVFTNAGYFVLQPDIVFRDRDPGVSATECVVTAVETVLEMGMIDRDRVGLVGHSWGGYEASFIPTQTDLFAASVAGAPLTNFFSMFGTIHWNQGMPEASHFETGQARMDVPYWDDMDAYVRNSPVMFVKDLETPMLVAFGDADGTVDWHQGVELYNYARRAGKQLVMLVYADENHSLRNKPNQIDYHHRVLEWFGHYLKGEKAARWITDGVSVLEAETNQ